MHIIIIVIDKEAENLGGSIEEAGWRIGRETVQLHLFKLMKTAAGTRLAKLSGSLGQSAVHSRLCEFRGWGSLEARRDGF